MSRELIPSGIEWVLDYPSAWKIVRFKDVYSSKKEIVGERVEDFERLSLTLKGVLKRPKDDSEGLQPKDFYTYQILRKNDMVFKMIDLQNISTSRVGLSPYDGLVSPAYLRFEPKDKPNEFMYYYFMSLYYNTVFNHIAGDGVRSALNATDIGNIKCPFPTYEEQEKIVLLLKDKIAKIDELIANQEKQISGLKEYKKTKITEILGTNNKQGERLKFYLSEQMMYGANESGYSYKEGYIRYIRITDITSDGELKNNEDNQYLPFDKAEPYLLEEGDILFARSGGTVGKSFIYKLKDESSAFAGYLIKAKCDKTKLLPEYLYFYTQSSKYESWKNMIFIQATIQNIGANKYSNMPIYVPSIEKQRIIIDEIIQLNNNFDELIKIKQQKIEKLNEYKKSLIYEYVTGKREVKEG